jgi:hypothetical protein
MLSEIGQAQRPNISCSHSFVKPRTTTRTRTTMTIIITMIMIIIEHECIWGSQWGEG